MLYKESLTLWSLLAYRKLGVAGRTCGSELGQAFPSDSRRSGGDDAIRDFPEGTEFSPD